VEPAGRVDVSFGPLRGEIISLPKGVTVINDCYNANPLSMRAALDDLATHPGRRVAILGDMLELGAGELEAHREIGAYAASAGVDVLVAVGRLSAAMADEFAGVSTAAIVPAAEAADAPSGTIFTAAGAAEAAAAAPAIVRPGDVVLVKASRGIALEAVAESLQEMEAPARG
jgi:UDP-N-acetylmuramoyl-tripeptide--D-alanyl-D-alanine ligase